MTSSNQNQPGQRPAVWLLLTVAVVAMVAGIVLGITHPGNHSLDAGMPLVAAAGALLVVISAAFSKRKR